MFKLRLSLTLLIGLFAFSPGHAQSPACPTVPIAHIAIANNIAATVGSKNYSHLNTLITQLFDSDEKAKYNRDDGLVRLLRWGKESESLILRETCLEKERSIFRYANALTGMQDELRLYFDGDKITRLTLLPGYTIDKIAGTPAKTNRNPVAEMNKYLDRLNSLGLFSGVVLVSKNGKPIFERAIGQADLTTGKPITTSTLFNMASTGKMFTATAIMQLVEQGKLSLSTTLKEALPDEADLKGTPAESIRIDQLLSHTSGLVNDFKNFSFPPGTKYQYSNMGYNVLGAVIEAVSKLTFDAYIRFHILGPSDMPFTGIYRTDSPVTELPTAYMPSLKGESVEFVDNPLLRHYPGSSMGGYWSTAREMMRFAEALRTGKLVKLETVALMRAKKTELNAPGYGFGIWRMNGPEIWGHPGDIPGTSSNLEIHCDTGLALVVLSNRSDGNGPVLAKARQLFFTGKCNNLP